MADRRPSVIDFRALKDDRLVVALRELNELVAGTPAVLVLDLGDRRTVAKPVVDALLVLHRALATAGGRCALVAAPALAVQVSAARPEGVLWAVDRRAAILALGGRPLSATAPPRRSPHGLVVRLTGALDLAALDAVSPVLAEAAGEPFAEVRFDLGEVTFADVTGMRALAFTAERCRAAGARVRVHGASTQIRRMVERLGWQNQLPGVTHGPAAAPHPSALRAALQNELARHDHATPVAAIATTLTGCVTHWNSWAERLYGWSRHEALGRPITELTVGPADQRLAHRILAAVQAAGHWEGRFEVRCKDGSTLLTNVRDTIVHDAQGRAVGFLGISHAAARPPAVQLKAA